MLIRKRFGCSIYECRYASDTYHYNIYICNKCSATLFMQSDPFDFLYVWRIFC